MGGTADSSQYSALMQVSRANAGKLQIAWSYPTGDDLGYSFNPLVVDGYIYVLARKQLDRGVGCRDRVMKSGLTPADPGTTIITHRGLNYWRSKEDSDRRLLFASNHMLAGRLMRAADG